MPKDSGRTARLERVIAELQQGNTAARHELLASARERLLRLTHRMFRHEHRLKRWEDTGDVFQNASLRLFLALAEVHPATVRDFFRLAALHIRRELIDLARHYYGPLGLGTRHTTRRDRDGEETLPPSYDRGDTDDEPSRLATWQEFHERVAELPDEEREMFDLLWYQELGQAEVAVLLGVSERTVQRRWQAARLSLHRALSGIPPG